MEATMLRETEPLHPLSESLLVLFFTLRIQPSEDPRDEGSLLSNDRGDR